MYKMERLITLLHLKKDLAFLDYDKLQLNNLDVLREEVENEIEKEKYHERKKQEVAHLNSLENTWD